MTNAKQPSSSPKIKLNLAPYQAPRPYLSENSTSKPNLVDSLPMKSKIWSLGKNSLEYPAPSKSNAFSKHPELVLNSPANNLNVVTQADRSHNNSQKTTNQR